MLLVKRGVRWSIGDGKKVKLLTDNWIPGVRPGSFHPLTPIPDGATVDCFLDGTHRAWDTDVVCSVLEEEVAIQVLQVPISRRRGEDFVSWPFTKFVTELIMFVQLTTWHEQRNSFPTAEKGSGTSRRLDKLPIIKL